MSAKKKTKTPLLDHVQAVLRAVAHERQCPLVANDSRCELVAGHDGVHVLWTKDGILLIGTIFENPN